MAGFLDHGQWPKYKRSRKETSENQSREQLGAKSTPAEKPQFNVRDMLLNATLWMFLGDKNWLRGKQVGEASRGGGRFCEKVRRVSGDAEAEFLKIHYAFDVRDYFFPAETDVARADYFRPNRRSWLSPWDGNELAAVFQSIRRVVKANNSTRVSYVAFFFSDPLKVEMLLRNSALASELAYGPAESRGRLAIDFFLPRKEDVESARDAVLDKLTELARKRCDEWNVTFDIKTSDFDQQLVHFDSEKNPPPPTSAPGLRAIVAFMFVGYFSPHENSRRDFSSFSFRAEHVPYERLYLVRPMLTFDDSLPLTVEFTDPERAEFVAAACRRFPKFADQLTWFREKRKVSLKPTDFETAIESVRI